MPRQPPGRVRHCRCMAAVSLRRVRSRLKSGMHRRWHSAVKRRSPRRLRSTIARYRGARQALHGATAGIVGPAIAAISLGLVGRRAMSTRTGRNFRYNAAGNALTAAAMGLLGSYLATRAIFLSAAALCVPALIALSRVRSSEIDYDRARNAGSGEHAKKLQRVIELAKNRPLLVFGACTLLFQLADASMLPLIGEELAQSKGALGSISMSGLIIVPAVLVALLAPWVGYHSERWGRKPLLLLGFGFEILRAILFAFVSGLPSLILVQ